MSASPADVRGTLAETTFQRALCLERKRAERARRRFVLMLLETGGRVPNTGDDSVLGRAARAVRSAIRETDIVGWHKEHSTVGVIFSELGAAATEAIVETLRSRISARLTAVLDSAEYAQIRIALHCLPDERKLDESDQPFVNVSVNLA